MILLFTIMLSYFENFVLFNSNYLLCICIQTNFVIALGPFSNYTVEGLRTDIKSPWGKPVICDIESYKYNFMGFSFKKTVAIHIKHYTPSASIWWIDNCTTLNRWRIKWS